MTAFAAVMRIEAEKRLWQKYSADCLGLIAQGLGTKDLPLFSEIITDKVREKPQTAEQIIDHVKNLFS